VLLLGLAVKGHIAVGEVEKEAAFDPPLWAGWRRSDDAISSKRGRRIACQVICQLMGTVSIGSKGGDVLARQALDAGELATRENAPLRSAWLFEFTELIIA
jgi:hypothetical protein